MTNKDLTIGELARSTGLSPHTLRFYETAGLLRPVVRSASGHRRYRAQDQLWLAFVLRLKKTGMPLAEIRRYADLREKGEESLSPRLAMLKLHHERLVSQIHELQECSAALEEKISLYERMLAAVAIEKEITP